jgi:hypothetical protein
VFFYILGTIIVVVCVYYLRRYLHIPPPEKIWEAVRMQYGSYSRKWVEVEITVVNSRLKHLLLKGYVPGNKIADSETQHGQSQKKLSANCVSCLTASSFSLPRNPEIVTHIPSCLMIQKVNKVSIYRIKLVPAPVAGVVQFLRYRFLDKIKTDEAVCRIAQPEEGGVFDHFLYGQNLMLSFQVHASNDVVKDDLIMLVAQHEKDVAAGAVKVPCVDCHEFFVYEDVRHPGWRVFIPRFITIQVAETIKRFEIKPLKAPAAGIVRYRNPENQPSYWFFDYAPSKEVLGEIETEQFAASTPILMPEGGHLLSFFTQNQDNVLSNELLMLIAVQLPDTSAD